MYIGRRSEEDRGKNDGRENRYACLLRCEMQRDAQIETNRCVCSQKSWKPLDPENVWTFFVPKTSTNIRPRNKSCQDGWHHGQVAMIIYRSSNPRSWVVCVPSPMWSPEGISRKTCFWGRLLSVVLGVVQVEHLHVVALLPLHLFALRLLQLLLRLSWIMWIRACCKPISKGQMCSRHRKIPAHFSMVNAIHLHHLYLCGYWTTTATHNRIRGKSPYQWIGSHTTSDYMLYIMFDAKTFSTEPHICL